MLNATQFTSFGLLKLLQILLQIESTLEAT